MISLESAKGAARGSSKRKRPASRKEAARGARSGRSGRRRRKKHKGGDRQPEERQTIVHDAQPTSRQSRSVSVGPASVFADGDQPEYLQHFAKKRRERQAAAASAAAERESEDRRRQLQHGEPRDTAAMSSSSSSESGAESENAVYSSCDASESSSSSPASRAKEMACGRRRTMSHDRPRSRRAASREPASCDPGPDLFTAEGETRRLANSSAISAMLDKQANLSDDEESSDEGSEAESRGAAGEGWQGGGRELLTEESRAAGSGAAQSRAAAAPSSWFPLAHDSRDDQAPTGMATSSGESSAADSESSEASERKLLSIGGARHRRRSRSFRLSGSESGFASASGSGGGDMLCRPLLSLGSRGRR